MRIEEVIGIFEEKKHDYLRKLTPDEQPVGIILGGQGAVGKGQLNRWAKVLYPTKQFLVINGDLYRNRHPNFKELRKDIWNYSKETQIFSNVFTERLIAEAIGQHFSFVVEGTMRSSSVAIQTSEILRSNGYQTAAFAIAACKEFSLLNAFVRYHKEVQTKGFGRMIDIDSHNAAVEGLPKSIDKLFHGKFVDRICLFDCFAKNMVMDYKLQEGECSSIVLPSEVIMATRAKQLKDLESIEDLLEASEIILENLDDGLVKERMEAAHKGLANSYSSLRFLPTR